MGMRELRLQRHNPRIIENQREDEDSRLCICDDWVLREENEKARGTFAVIETENNGREGESEEMKYRMAQRRPLGNRRSHFLFFNDE